MKILYIASNPEEAPPLQIEKEANLLREKLDALTTSDSVDLRVYASLDVSTLPEVISRAAPDILHFAAHGKDDGIVLAHQERGTVFLNGEKLTNILVAISARPKLIVVNACRSAEMAKALCRVADFAIGVDAPISNVGARTMAATLYHRLASSSSIFDAYLAATTMLEVIDEGEANAVLFPTGSEEEARWTRLADPFRIVACFPAVEEWLKLDQLDSIAAPTGKVNPIPRFNPDLPEIQFGLAGCPATVRQIQFFTDDETVRPGKDQSLADVRGWMLEVGPVSGEIWINDKELYYGSMQWFGTAVTGEPRIISATATTVEALQRYYFDEAWHGDIPESISIIVKQAISNLKGNDGSRRGRGLKSKAGMIPR